MVALRFAAISLAAIAGCSSSAKPIDVRPGDACATCRMTVSDPKVAAQIAAPGEEPRFYDDIGCLATAIAGGARADLAFVADHRTGEWVLASNAVLTVVPTVDTPMGSHVIAHANEASRQDDAAAAGGTRTTLTAIVEGARARRTG